MSRHAAILALLFGIVSACSREAAPASETAQRDTPHCDRLIELGQLDIYSEVPPPSGDSAEAVRSAFFEKSEMPENVSMSEMKNIVGQCIVYMAHARDFAEGPHTERIRMILEEPATEDSAPLVVAAGERFLCRDTQRWQPSAC